MRQIIKAKLSDTLRLTVDYLDHVMGADEDQKPDKVTKECDAEAHPDLIAAFDALKIHFATICEQGNYTEFEDEPAKLEIFRLNQFSLSGENEHMGITLSGGRVLKTNKVLNINTPFTKLSKDHSDYGYASSLDMGVQNLLSEVDEYLNGKHAPKRQLDLFPEASDDAPVEEAADQEVMEKPKKTRKKKIGNLEVHVEG